MPNDALILVIGSGPPPSALDITTGSLTGAQVGVAYTFTPGASGGTAPYFWTLDGASPNYDFWLNMLNGVLQGTPQLAETESVTLRVSDSSSTQQTASVTLTLVVSD